MNIKKSLLLEEYSRNYYLYVQSTQNNDTRNQLIQATRLELLGRLLGYKEDKEISSVVRGVR